MASKLLLIGKTIATTPQSYIRGVDLEMDLYLLPGV